MFWCSCWGFSDWAADTQGYSSWGDYPINFEAVIDKLIGFIGSPFCGQEFVPCVLGSPLTCPPLAFLMENWEDLFTDRRLKKIRCIWEFLQKFILYL